MRITSTELIPSAPRPPSEPLADSNVTFVTIAVSVSPSGKVKGVKILHSAGAGFDQRYLHIARTSKYLPKMVNCKTVEGIYYFSTPGVEGAQHLYAPIAKLSSLL
jgi:TonB family protein